jgi:hypothetical protein
MAPHGSRGGYTMWWKSFVSFICRIKLPSPLQQAGCQTPLSRAWPQNLEDFPMEMQSPIRAVWFAHGKAAQSCDCYKGCLKFVSKARSAARQHAAGCSERQLQQKGMPCPRTLAEVVTSPSRAKSLMPTSLPMVGAASFL